MADDRKSPSAERPEPPANSEHLNIKVTDNNNEVFFKIKRSTKLEKLMTAFCERQGKSMSSVRFLFEGTRVQPGDTPDAVSFFSDLPAWATPRRGRPHFFPGEKMEPETDMTCRPA